MTGASPGAGGADDACAGCGSRTPRAADTVAGRRLEWLSLGWCAVEAGVGLAAGIAAGSPALEGFGGDSVVEMLSGLVLLWRLGSHEHGPARERRALRLVGACFLALAAAIGYEAVTSLAAREAPRGSTVGIALAIASIVGMPLLARAKRRVAARLGSRALEADSRQADLCAYLSAILLAGLGLNAALGWWWADAAAALVMVPIVALEGVRALRGETCDCG